MEEWPGQLIPHVHTTLRPSLVRSDEIEVNSTSYQNKMTKLEIHSHEMEELPRRIVTRSQTGTIVKPPERL